MFKTVVTAASLAAFVLTATALADGYKPYNWTGLYFGGNLGYGMRNTDVDLSGSSGALYWNDPFETEQETLDSGSGLVGGLQFGADKHFGSLLVGVAIDVTFGELEDEGTYTTPLGSQWHITSTLNTLALARGRIGLVVTPRLMTYATAGLAFGQFNVKQATTFVNGAGEPIDDGGRVSGDVNHFGYTVGGGFEYLFARGWTFGSEYLFVDFGKEDYALKGTTKPYNDTPHTETFAAEKELHMFRGTLNYRF